MTWLLHREVSRVQGIAPQRRIQAGAWERLNDVWVVDTLS